MNAITRNFIIPYTIALLGVAITVFLIGLLPIYDCGCAVASCNHCTMWFT